MQEIDLEIVNKLLNSNSLDLTATQEALCLPILQRIYKKMKIGIQFDGIEVNDSRIVDGHHRYICSQLAEFEIELIEWEIAKSSVDYDWSIIEVVEEDYEDERQIKEHNVRDAELNDVDITILENL